MLRYFFILFFFFATVFFISLGYESTAGWIVSGVMSLLSITMTICFLCVPEYEDLAGIVETAEEMDKGGLSVD